MFTCSELVYVRVKMRPHTSVNKNKLCQIRQKADNDKGAQWLQGLDFAAWSVKVHWTGSPYSPRQGGSCKSCTIFLSSDAEKHCFRSCLTFCFLHFPTAFVCRLCECLWVRVCISFFSSLLFTRCEQKWKTKTRCQLLEAQRDREEKVLLCSANSPPQSSPIRPNPPSDGLL